MAIRFDPDFNYEIDRTVRSFNQKVRRAQRRGEKNLPKLRHVTELKSQFTTRTDMKRELGELKKMLNNKEALRRHQTKDGSITNWEYDYIVNNLRSTEKWIDRELEKARDRFKKYPDHLYAIRADVKTLEQEKRVITSELDKLTAAQLKVVGGTIDRYKHRNVKIAAGRSHFMRNLDFLLTAKGTPTSTKKSIFKKLDSLSNDQFNDLYNTHDVISEVMIMIPSLPDSKNEEKMAEFEVANESTREILDNFENGIDYYIDEVKGDVIFDASTQQYIPKKQYEDMLKATARRNKLKR